MALFIKSRRAFQYEPLMILRIYILLCYTYKIYLKSQLSGVQPYSRLLIFIKPLLALV